MDSEGKPQRVDAEGAKRDGRADEEGVVDPFASELIGRASDLAPDSSPEELGFEQDAATYKSFQIVHADRQHPEHDLERGFYVKSSRGTIGYVPWPGSTVVWPWEAGWEQDLSPGKSDFVKVKMKDEK